MGAVKETIASISKTETAPPPDGRRRFLRASGMVLMMQEAAAQLRNDVNAALREAHRTRAKLPSVKALREEHKRSPSGIALGRAKQVQYVIDAAVAAFASYRSNYLAWVKYPSSRPGKPRPPGFYRRGQRCRITFDYQEFKVIGERLFLPASLGLNPIALSERGQPMLGPGDRVVQVHLDPARSRRYIIASLVIRRAAKAAAPRPLASGHLLVDLGVARLATCLNDREIETFFVDGSVAKAILHRGAKVHARLRSEAAQGTRHGKARAGALAARSAHQMEDLMKKVARLVVAYAAAKNLAEIVVGQNKGWKQGVNLGSRTNQLFTFLPLGKLAAAIQVKAARAGIAFSETEESYTSKTDHLAQEEMGPKPEGYRWLGSRSPRGCFRSSVGTTLQSDVNGCIGIGRKVGGKEWLGDFLRRLGAFPGTRLVPRKVHVNGWAAVGNRGLGSRHPRLDSPRAWISTKVALEKAGFLPASGDVPVGTNDLQTVPEAA